MDFSPPPASDGPSATTQSQQSCLLFWGTMVSHQKGCVCGKGMRGCGCKGCKDAMRGLREVYIGGWKKAVGSSDENGSISSSRHMVKLVSFCSQRQKKG